MRHILPRACLCSLSLALLMAPVTAPAFVNATVYQNGPAFIIDHDTQLTGHAAAELAGGASVGAGSYAYVGSAYANNRSGSLGGAVTTSGSGYAARDDRLTVLASSSFSEWLTFSHSGPVSFRLAVQGSFAVDAGGEARSFASLMLSAQAPARALASARGLTYFSTSNVFGAVFTSALRSNYIVWLEDSFTATAGVPLPVAARLEVFVTPPVTGSAQALFAHTARLAIFTPAGVSFSSASGDFMADVRSPVPEPATLWLWLLGVVLTVGSGRRASRAQVAGQRMQQHPLGA